MNEMFRKAAENYPLKTDERDFQAVLAQLQKPAPPTSPKRISNIRKWPLLLLAPLVFLYHQPILNSAGGSGTYTTVKVKSPQGAVSEKATGTETLLPGKSVETQNTPLEKEQPGIMHTTEIDKYSSKASAGNKSSLEPVEEEIAKDQNNSIKKSGAGEALALKPATSKLTTLTSEQQKQLDHSDDLILADTPTNKIIAGKKEIDLKDSEPTVENSTPKTDSVNDLTTQTATSPKPVEKTPAGEDSIETSPQVIKPKKQQGFYLGAFAGIDFSTVKSMHSSGPGHNSGLLFGYRINRNWSVETGATWNHKRYYAAGEYVSTDKLNLPNHSTVINMDGWCNMVEVPILVKYAFGKKALPNWYAIAGTSSYFMTKESYDILYTRYGAAYNYNKSYKNSTTNLFSVLQLSVGYQFTIGKKTTLNIAPYLKLPVGKIGIGQLPMSSGGLNIGIIRPL